MQAVFDNYVHAIREIVEGPALGSSPVALYLKFSAVKTLASEVFDHAANIPEDERSPQYSYALGKLKMAVDIYREAVLGDWQDSALLQSRIQSVVTNLGKFQSSITE